MFHPLVINFISKNIKEKLLELEKKTKKKAGIFEEEGFKNY